MTNSPIGINHAFSGTAFSAGRLCSK